MFLQVSVCPQGGGVHPPGKTRPWADTHPGQTPRRPSRHPSFPLETTTAADGTYPTGMHSCFHICAPLIYKPRMWAKMMCAHTTTYMYISTLLFHLNMTYALRIFYDYLSLMFLIVDRYILSSSSHK